MTRRRGDMNFEGVIEMSRLACKMLDFGRRKGRDWFGEIRAGDNRDDRISRFEIRSYRPLA
jgi:hypothetical protein